MTSDKGAVLFRSLPIHLYSFPLLFPWNTKGSGCVHTQGLTSSSSEDGSKKAVDEKDVENTFKMYFKMYLQKTFCLSAFSKYTTYNIHVNRSCSIVLLTMLFGSGPKDKTKEEC